MTPIDFKEANKDLTPGLPIDHASVKEVRGISIWTDGILCTSCWKMSLRERISALIFGKVWISVVSGDTQPAMSAMAERSIFEQTDAS